MGAGKYGVTQLANLGALPSTGVLFFVAPLKLTGGTGSPVRAFALLPS
jgi:kynurenine formamidase